MALARFAYFGILLHLAIAIPLLNKKQNRNITAYNNYQVSHLWQRSGKYQGDMVLTPKQKALFSDGNGQKNGIIDPNLRWPNGRIPYQLSSSFSKKEKEFIKQVLEEDYGRSCLSVVPRTNETDHVYITVKDEGCWSSVGREGGRQELNLQRDECLEYSTIVHEFLHAVGFHHQHSATERDAYVTIEWDNIEKGEEYNFDKFGDDVITSFGEPYDYDSLMHYDAYAFSANGEKTIIPTIDVEIGMAEKLSDIDIKKLNKMYDCSKPIFN